VQTLEVVGLGDVPRAILDAAATAPAAAFGFLPKTRPALAEPRYAFNPSRGQHHGQAILRKIAGGRSAGSGPVLGVGVLDLFVPDLPFVLGDWDRDLGAAIVGVQRLIPGSPDVVARRVGAVGIWAVGRALGLPDCEDARCPMGYPELDTLDRRLAVPCARCQNALNAFRERVG
jgi:archaemetzincin